MPVWMLRTSRSELIAALRARGVVYAPVARAGELVFDALGPDDALVWDYRNTRRAPKELFLPQQQALLRYRSARGAYNAYEPAGVTAQPGVLLAARSCDARALLLLDAVLLDGPYRDPHYAAQRGAIQVWALACDHPRPTCFCHALGGDPYSSEGADVLMRPAGEGLLLEGVTARGEALLAELAAEGTLVPADDAALAVAQSAASEARARLAAMPALLDATPALEGLFDDLALWREVAATCLACGTCTYLCPACHCFNIVDRPTAAGGERLRAWDACMYAGFTVHASGHNPRPDQAARWRQRVMHKFSYLPANVGRLGCVGCGRCVLACPTTIDIRRVLVRVLERAQAAESPAGGRP